MQDLPLLYLQGGSIVPVGRPIQYVGEESLSDDLILLIALDDHGKANGILYEDAGDGYDFYEGEFLLSYYEAELESSVVTVRVSRSEGSWRRPRRALHVHLLLGFGATVGSDLQTAFNEWERLEIRKISAIFKKSYR
ncbi:hypothetical protein EJ110_NYTH33834 [Nymphaea thermarum]|nr:hypothetical protein EJ110_NYTH33834 [Nymphaea thermarum]